jgi:hypothetical protein
MKIKLLVIGIMLFANFAYASNAKILSNKEDRLSAKSIIKLELNNNSVSSKDVIVLIINSTLRLRRIR